MTKSLLKTIRLKGDLKEQAFKLINFVIATELSTEAGARHFSIQDTLNNNGDYPKEYEALYHRNFGPTLLDPSAVFSAPVHQRSRRLIFNATLWGSCPVF